MTNCSSLVILKVLDTTKASFAQLQNETFFKDICPVNYSSQISSYY
jgi:hypothetical protein